jgi:hypothetical protein
MICCSVAYKKTKIKAHEENVNTHMHTTPDIKIKQNSSAMQEAQEPNSANASSTGASLGKRHGRLKAEIHTGHPRCPAV